MLIIGTLIIVGSCVGITLALKPRNKHVNVDAPPQELATISDELEQNQRWWERECEAQKQKCFPPKPFNTAEHEGHDLIDVTTYAGAVVRSICSTCREPKDY